MERIKQNTMKSKSFMLIIFSVALLLRTPKPNLVVALTPNTPAYGSPQSLTMTPLHTSITAHFPAWSKKQIGKTQASSSTPHYFRVSSLTTMNNLTGIPPAPRGVPQIEVTFDIDADGILKVSAKDLATNKEQRITITASTKLSKEEKEKMIKEAEQFSEADRKKREEAEARNNADSLMYTANLNVLAKSKEH